jgi:hypothetical protein
MRHEITRNETTDKLFRAIPSHYVVGFLPLLSSLSGLTPCQSQTDASKNHRRRQQKAR